MRRSPSSDDRARRPAPGIERRSLYLQMRFAAETRRFPTIDVSRILTIQGKLKRDAAKCALTACASRKKIDLTNSRASHGRTRKITRRRRESMNDPRKLFVNERLRGRCVFCGGIPDTRDHCPSKVLLDEPFPANLAMISACGECNQSFSKDEQYLACLPECVIRGSTDPELLRRTNVRWILVDTPGVACPAIRAGCMLNQEYRRHSSFTVAKYSQRRRA